MNAMTVIKHYKIPRRLRAQAVDAVAQELIKWLEKDQLALLGRAQRLPQLEERARILEYGKWCSQNGLHLMGIKPQIKYRGSQPETTTRQTIRDISDDEGMEIHAATLGLSQQQLYILERVYQDHEAPDDVIAEMRIRRQTFFDLRWEALETIANKLA